MANSVGAVSARPGSDVERRNPQRCNAYQMAPSSGAGVIVWDVFMLVSLPDVLVPNREQPVIRTTLSEIH